MVDVAKTGNQQQVTQVKASKGGPAPKDAPVPGPGSEPIKDAVDVAKPPRWNSKVKFQDNPFTAINMTAKDVTANHVGLRNFFKLDDVVHNTRVNRGTIQQATAKTLPKHGNVSSYSYEWVKQPSGEYGEKVTVNNKAKFKDLQDAVKKGRLVQQEFEVEYKVHHSNAAKGGTDFNKVAMTTFHDYEGRVVYALDHMKPNADGVWARLRQEMTEKGAKILQHVKF